MILCGSAFAIILKLENEVSAVFPPLHLLFHLCSKTDVTNDCVVCKCILNFSSYIVSILRLMWEIKLNIFWGPLRTFTKSPKGLNVSTGEHPLTLVCRSATVLYLSRTKHTEKATWPACCGTQQFRGATGHTDICTVVSVSYGFSASSCRRLTAKQPFCLVLCFELIYVTRHWAYSTMDWHKKVKGKSFRRMIMSNETMAHSNVSVKYIIRSAKTKHL